MSFGNIAPIPSFIKPQRGRAVCENSKDPLARILAESERRVNRVKTVGKNDRFLPRKKKGRKKDQQIDLDVSAFENLVKLAEKNTSDLPDEKQKELMRQLGEMCSAVTQYQTTLELEPDSQQTEHSKWLASFYTVLSKMLHEVLSHTSPAQLIKLSASLWQWYLGKKKHFDRKMEDEKKKEENARKNKDANAMLDGMMRRSHPQKFTRRVAPTWGQTYVPYRPPTSCGDLEDDGFDCVERIRPERPKTPPRYKCPPAIGSPAPPAAFGCGTISQGLSSTGLGANTAKQDSKQWLSMYVKRDLASNSLQNGKKAMLELPIRAADTSMNSTTRDAEAAVLPYTNSIYRRPATSIGFVTSPAVVQLKKAKSAQRCKLAFAFYDPSNDDKEQHMHQMYMHTVEGKLHSIRRRGLLT